MPLIITGTTYAGKDVEGFISRASTKSDTINKGGIYVTSTPEAKLQIKRIGVSDSAQAYKATPVAADSGSVDVTYRNLDLTTKFMFYQQYEPRDFENEWSAAQLSANLLNPAHPTIEGFITDQYMLAAMRRIELLIWQGDKAALPATRLQFVDGLIKKLNADAGTLKVASPVALTAANIVSKLDAGKALVPQALLYDPSLNVYMSYRDAQFYSDAQKAQANKGVDFTNQGVLKYNGWNVMPCAGMPNDTFVIAKGNSTKESNLWMATSTDPNELENFIKLGPVANNSEEWFIKMALKMDVNVGFTEECVLYKV